MAEYIEREAALDCLHLVCVPQCRKYAQKEIKKIPAADVAHVRHGRWRLYSPLTDTYECDKCGYQVIDESFRTNYCPNCGAKMEGEE